MKPTFSTTLKFVSLLSIALLVAPLLAGETAAEYVPAIKSITVNGEKIDSEVIKKFYEDMLRRWKASGKEISKELRDKLFEKSREQAIYHEAVRQFIEKEKLTVTPEVLKKEIDAMKAELIAEGKTFEDLLKQLKKTEEEFGKAYAPRAALRRYVAAELKKEEEQAALKKKFDAGKDKVPFRRASHVLVSFEKCKFTTHPERKKEDALALAKAALERATAVKGESFADLVKEFSDDNRTKTKNGDLGWLKVADMPKPFIDALYTLEKVNDITKELVESELGFHVIQMTGIVPEEDAFKQFIQIAVKTRTIDLENRLFKESKVEDVK